jgi:hypothetical protein
VRDTAVRGRNELSHEIFLLSFENHLMKILWVFCVNAFIIKKPCHV